MVYYKTNLSVKDFEINNASSVCENICLICNSVIYVLLYLPPSTATTVVESFFEALVNTIDKLLIENPSFKICLLGDFNRFGTKYLSSNLNLKNVVTQNTRKNAILDKCFVSKIWSSQFDIHVKDPIGNSDHNLIICSYKDVQNLSFSHKTFFDLRESNIQSFMHCVAQIEWGRMYQINEVNSKCQFFTSELQNAIGKIPTYSIKNTSKDKKWITSLCKHLINRRWEAFRKKDFGKYNHYKQKVKEEIKKAKHLYYEKCKRSQSGMWTFVKNNKSKSGSDINCLKNSDESTESLCQRINTELSTRFTPKIQGCESKTVRNSDDVYIILDEEEVELELRTLKTSKATGSDGLPNSLLKRISHQVATPLCHILNSSLLACAFPDMWKKAFIVAIPKSKPARIDKLRPISLLPNVSKLYEKLILKRISPYFTDFITSNQFGFMPKSSTSSCLIHIQDTITNYLESSSVLAVSVISFDLQRAFDCLPHFILLQKLKSVLPHNVYVLISSYLENRSQCVMVNGTCSSQTFISSGVPQGSILSPFLFNVFINDLELGEDCKTFKYADDTTVVLPHTNPAVTEDIDRKILSMESWCEKNFISLNMTKTQITTIQKNTSLTLHKSNCKEMKVLGVTFTDDLKWKKHTEQVLKKASQRVFLICQLRTTLQKNELLILYKALIESILTYAGSLFIKLPNKLNNKINALAKRCHNIICGKNCDCLILPDKIRERNGIRLFQKATEDPSHPLHCLIPEKLRRSGKFRQPIALTERRKNCFIPTITEIFNSL